MNAEVLGVLSAVKYYSCCSCKKKVEYTEGSTVANCNSCHLTQKISASSTQWVVKLYCKDQQNPTVKMYLTAFNEIANQLAAKCKVESISTISEKELRSKLLQLETINIVYDSIQKRILELQVE